MTHFSPLRVSVAALIVCFVATAVNYRAMPAGDATLRHFDAIIVLGAPSTDTGEPSPEQRQRVEEGVREVKAGSAPRLIVTGGAAHNRFVEAASMGRLARELGLPVDAIFEEPRAQNTIQNVFYSAEIMRAHGWHSAEVVSSPSHLPRAGLILSHFDRSHPDAAFAWHTHAALWPPEYSFVRKAVLYMAESIYCLRLRLFGFPAKAAPFFTHP